MATLPGHEGSFKVHKKASWMTQRAKKEVFGHFLEFGLLDWLDIAYCDSTKCFPTFCNITRSWRIIQKAQYCIFEWCNEPKNALSNNVGPVAVIDFDFYWLVHIKFVCCFVSSSQWWYIMTITKFSVMWLDCQLLYTCYQFIPCS